MTAAEAANNEKVFKRMRDAVCASPEASRRALDMIGRGLRDTARKNARAKGGRSFWGQVANSVDYQMGANEVVVGASHHAAAQKQFGGRISAPGRKPGAFGAKSLAIPIKDNVPRNKRSPRLWAPGELFFIKSKNPRNVGLLARNKGTGKNKALEVMFVLKKSVLQSPDPWWPTDRQIADSTRLAVARVAKFYGMGG